MAAKFEVKPNHELELVLGRILDAPVEKVFEAWTNPRLLAQWFCPKPWFVTDVVVEKRVGGAFESVMHGPNGEKMPNRGMILEIVPNRRIVFTDAYIRDFQPTEKPFFTGTIELEPEGNRTRYVARAAHWKREDYESHRQMGFEEGWSVCADQLEALVKGL